MEIPVSDKVIRAERKGIRGLELCTVGNVDSDSDSGGERSGREGHRTAETR